jgi:hypothetical protein
VNQTKKKFKRFKVIQRTVEIQSQIEIRQILCAQLLADRRMDRLHWTGFICLRITTSGGIFTSGSIKGGEFLE